MRQPRYSSCQFLLVVRQRAAIQFSPPPSHKSGDGDIIEDDLNAHFLLENAMACPTSATGTVGAISLIQPSYSFALMFTY